MIVKNEAHLIIDCFKMLSKYIKFDYWVINDNGSTDGTQKLIKDYFAEQGIPGELDETPWRDFAFNRTHAFQVAYKKTDYAFVWDADDEIWGDFKLPEKLVADQYKFIFGNEGGTRYSRVQLFNNHLKWHYVGVLHEYPACLETVGPLVDVLGNYYFISGRRGARNNDPNKYLNDALILEKAFNEAFEKKDPIYNRYCFYTAQSYNSCNRHEKAIEYYKKVLDIDNWVQEKYVSCIEIYDQYDKLKRNQEGLFYLLESFKYDRRRIEGIYRLIKYYCINGPVEAAYAYYTMISDHYENQFVKENVADYLFTKKEEYDFYLPYYMVIVSQRVDRHDTCIKMLQMIFNQGYLLSGEWWLHNLFHNIQFAIPHMPPNLEFLESMLTYIENLKKRGYSLNSNNYKIIDKIIAHFRPLLVAPVLTNLPLIGKGKGKKCRVMLTVTTCKRFDLFEQTVNSILKCWTDLDKVDLFYCVDDNSSDEDRLKMQTQFPFFTYHMKSKDEKGHRESMNVIWSKVVEVKPEYWIHMEDDWLYFKKENYVERAISALEKYEKMNVHQLVFNREYGLMMSDMERVNVAPLGPREDGLVIHIKANGVQGPNCAYWPHYSLQPSVCRASKIIELGNYNSPNNFFERDYADKYHAAGYQTIFFDSIYSLHIGKQHWEKDGQNAYALNQINQLSGQSGGTDTTVEVLVQEVNEPLKGSMSEHLDAILNKIKSQTPFGLIRPSDGEHTILMDKTLTNCDNWTFEKGGKLRQDLLEAVKTQDPNLYIGIPCNTCNKPWNCTDKIYNDFTQEFQVPLAQRTYANIFGNSNWQKFSNFMKSYNKRFYLITSGTAPSNLPIKERYIIDSKLVNQWDLLNASETERLLNFIKDKKRQLICFSAGPLSKIWIPICMKANPDNMYLDIGASLDVFTKGQTNRLYTNPQHSFSKETCIFKDTIPDLTLSTTIPSILPNMTKNLIYLGVFFNKDYIELLRIFLVTAKLYSSLDSIDFLVFTSKDFAPDIQKLSKLLGIPLQMKFFSFNSVHEASCARLFIFDYENAMAYDKIMYLDTDIIVQGDLMNIFNEPIEDKIYGMKEGTIEHEIHGGWWFDFSTIDKNTVAMNGGILLFKATETMKQIFCDINNHVQDIKTTGKPMPECADQPFVNYHFIKANKYDNKMLEKHGLIYCVEPPPPPSAPTDIVLCHFVWPIGDANHKMGRMKPHVTHILKYFREISGKRAFFETSLVGQGFRWNGSDGIIRFEPNNVLVTKWANGTYKWLGENSLMASWAGIDHFLRFNEDFSEFQSVRLGDLEYVKGKKQMKFYDENGNQVDTMRFETVEQSQAEQYITEDCTVLELGARYGTVSCIINKKLKNPFNQVSVEPDTKVWKCLEKNMHSNGCNFHLIKGVISRVPLSLTEHPVFVGYGNQTVKSEQSSLPNFTVEEIEEKYSLKFDTLVADCEGFLGQFFEENPHLYKQLKLVMFEKDSPGTCDYSVILQNLKDHGFVNLVTGFHEVWKKPDALNVFTQIYETGVWGDNGISEYKGSSGDGSLVEKNQEYIGFLKSFIKEKDIKSVSDLGCGDWKCGNLIYDDLPISYNGYDAYGKLVEYNQRTFGNQKYSFKQLDFLNFPEQIEQADICIIKDVLQHWPLKSIYTFLDTICNSKKFKYIIITNCSYQNKDDTDIPMGQFRPLSKDFLPLKKYNPSFLLAYQSKEVILLVPV
jgi:FkbM family methyltransferase